MKISLKIVLITLLVSAPLFWVFNRFGGALGSLLAMGVPFLVFSFLFVSNNSYEGFFKNYVYPLLTSMCLFAVGLVVIGILEINNTGGYSVILAPLAIISIAPQAIVFSALGSFFGRSYRNKKVSQALPI